MSGALSMPANIMTDYCEIRKKRKKERRFKKNVQAHEPDQLNMDQS